MSAVSSIEVIRNNGVVMVKIPPSWLTIELDLEGSSGSRPEVALDVIERYHPQALICGPMFSKENGHGSGYTDYTLARLLYRYLDMRNNINISSRYPTRGATVSVVNNQAFFHRGDRIEAGATFGIQGYPSMIENSQNQSSTVLDLNSTGRACVGIHQDGSVVFAIYTGGIRSFSDKLISMGVKAATYMDGGGSTSLFGPNNTTIGLRSRRLPSYILAIPPNQPSLSQAIPQSSQDLNQTLISNTGPVSVTNTTPAPVPQAESSQPPIVNQAIIPRREDIPVEQDIDDEGDRPDESHEDHQKGGYLGVVTGVASRNPLAASIPALLIAGTVGFLAYKYWIRPKYLKNEIENTAQETKEIKNE